MAERPAPEADGSAEPPSRQPGTGPSGTGPSGTGPSDTGPSGTGPSGTGPSDTGLSGTGPSATGRMARLLAAAAGWVDAAGYVALFHVFTAHQSGNTSGFAVAITGGDWTTAWRRGISIGAYLLGLALGPLLVEQCRRRCPRWSGTVVAGAEVAALGAALAVGEVAARTGSLVPADTAPYAAAVAVLAGAMGLQGVNLRQVGNRVVRTTFVTGMLINMVETFVVAWHTSRGDERRSLLGVSGLLGSVSAAFLIGAVAGAAAERVWGFAALGVPIAVVAGMAAWEVRIGFQPSMPHKATPNLSD